MIHDYLWHTKIFKTKEKAQAWVDKYGHKCQWNQIFVNNAWGIEYRKLRRVY